MMRQLTPSPVHRRMNALLVLDDGRAAARVAASLFIDVETVREQRRLYVTSGVTGVERLNYERSDAGLIPERLKSQGAELDACLYITAKAACAFVERAVAVIYTPHAIAKLLKRLGSVYKMSKRCRRKRTKSYSESSRKISTGPLMKAANDDTPLYFVDGTHASYTAHTACGWIRKGETRELKSNHGRLNIGINDALSWPGREFVHRQGGRITSAKMVLLFEDLQARHRTATAIGWSLTTPGTIIPKNSTHGWRATIAVLN
jgi:transposase